MFRGFAILGCWRQEYLLIDDLHTNVMYHEHNTHLVLYP